MAARLGLAVWIFLCALIPGVAIAASIYGLSPAGDLRASDLPPKTVILTFDDGPSPYTQQILDILAAKHVHAVFFVVGSQAIRYPILKKIYDAGNEIGDHTYTHTDLTTMPDWRVHLELNLTRQIITAQTGHSARLFRPPYLGSDTITTASEDLITRVDSYGYLTVGEDIDTSDWERPGAVNIVRNATEQAGGVVLMHDGGGDRSQTVKALPQIIQYYRDRGYQFVTMSEALNVPRAALMPVPTPTDEVLASITGGVFGVALGLGQLLWWIVLVLIIIGGARMCLVVAAAIVQSRRKAPPEMRPDLPCTVVIPAYNESKVILSCLRSVLASDYRAYEVIVVDDGSTDNTAKLAETLAHARLRVVRKPNGGKASALNFGINEARADFIVAIDADTVFEPGTLSRLMRHFRDDRVGAVSGNTRIANRHNLLTQLQSLEYIVGFNLDRRMGDLFDCITVVPGAIGAFRKSVMYEVRGFQFDTLAEDTELTLAIKEAGYKIVYDGEALAYTEAPAKLRDLMKQRYRWTFGTMQAVWKHRRSLLNPRHGTLGMFGLPYLVVFQIIFPLFGPFFDLAVVIGLIQRSYHLIIVAFIIYTAADVLVSMVALMLDGERLWRLWLLLPQRLIYRQLMYYVIVRSFVNVLRGRLVGWGALERSGEDLIRVSEVKA